MTIGQWRPTNGDQTDRYPLTTLRDTTDVLAQQDLGRSMPAKLLLRKSTTAAWIAMIATELHQENDANTLDWFPPGSM